MIESERVNQEIKFMYTESFFSYVLLTFILSIVATQNNFAQHHSDLRFGVGYWSSYSISRQLKGSDPFFGRIDQMSVEKKELVKYVQYDFRIGKRASIGVVGAYNSFVILNVWREGEVARNKFQQTTLAIAGRYYYGRQTKSLFQLYGSCDFGIAFRKSQTRDYSIEYSVLMPQVNRRYFKPTSQLTPVAVSTGKRWGGYVEFGYGFKGILNGGFFFRP